MKKEEKHLHLHLQPSLNGKGRWGHHRWNNTQEKPMINLINVGLALVFSSHCKWSKQNETVHISKVTSRKGASVICLRLGTTVGVYIGIHIIHYILFMPWRDKPNKNECWNRRGIWCACIHRKSLKEGRKITQHKN